MYCLLGLLMLPFIGDVDARCVSFVAARPPPPPLLPTEPADTREGLCA